MRMGTSARERGPNQTHTRTDSTYGDVRGVGVPSPMRVAVVVVPCGEHADQIDGQPERADDEQLGRVHLGRVQEPLDRLEHDEDRDQAEEEAVGEAGEGLDARVPGQ